MDDLLRLSGLRRPDSGGDEQAVARPLVLKQFGQKIGKNQGVSFKLADMRTQLEAAELLTLRAAWLDAQGRATDEDMAMAKVFSSEMCQFVTDEAIQKECLEGRQMVWFVDITTETKPTGVASWTVPEKSGQFCTRGGRFGTHSSNEHMTPVFHKRVMFFAHFNAGVRALDIRTPFAPKEIAYYIPAMNANTVVLETPASQRGKLPFTAASERRAIQTNNVETDSRGYIYIVDRANTGLHILELTGEARQAAGLPQ